MLRFPLRSIFLRSINETRKFGISEAIKRSPQSRCFTSGFVQPLMDDVESIRELRDSLKSKTKPDKVLDFSDLRSEVHHELLNPNMHRGIQSTDLPGLNSILKGHRKGELTILTGSTGIGKTTVISQLSLDYCKSGVPTLWGSFEILNKRLAKKMLSQFAEKDLAGCPEEFDTFADRFEKLPLYFLKFHSSTAIKEVLDVCREAVESYGIQHIIIDNLQFMLSQQARSGLDKWELQENAIANLRSFATLQDVHITLVVHPRKETGEGLDINSIFGSAKVTQEADNVIIIQKHRKYRTIDIKKNRYDGTLGSVKYTFNKDKLKIEELATPTNMAREKASFPTTTIEKISKKYYDQ
ncbi:P-loop containing nucleoside triphosphate hydrolase protein [Sporodiniella umbellata]|nr:P-loop containing nucleoside triphosphate hydrolase protein [Sporodiniella umbellata]